MTSLRQIEANRRNARLSTGPVTAAGKTRSRQNAVRHGLTAETVIARLEDASDYAAFEQAIASDYDAQTADLTVIRSERQAQLPTFSKLANLFSQMAHPRPPALTPVCCRAGDRPDQADDLLQSSGEWITSDWRICLVAER